ncbi:MAG: hypothetical protein HUK08_09630 [Bacteroidaceae bacterium]|nr:hypothetical protein [Bacteroidaceae bacterium]
MRGIAEREMWVGHSFIVKNNQKGNKKMEQNNNKFGPYSGPYNKPRFAVMQLSAESGFAGSPMNAGVENPFDNGVINGDLQ